MMKGLFTREPSFCGNTGYNGNVQQPCGLQVLPINKRGGYKGNTYLYISIDPDSVCCRFKKAATGCQKNIQLNQWRYRCCLVAPLFANQAGELYRGGTENYSHINESVTPFPSWQAFFAQLNVSRWWGYGSTVSPAHPCL